MNFKKSNKSGSENGASSVSAAKLEAVSSDSSGVFSQKQLDGLPHVDYKFILNEGSTLKGDLTLSQRALIAGSVEGTVRGDCLVSVAATATLVGDIEAENIVVAGKVEGNLLAKEKLTLVAPAEVVGSIAAPSLSIAEGVVFQGQCQMTAASQTSSKQTPELTAVAGNAE